MLVKNIFRTEIKEILLEHMIQGKITPGIRISLPQLAEELEVSVTPIREALTQLTEIGITTYIPNRGFFVTELSETEASEIFETISILECEALKKSTFSKQRLKELKAINDAFTNSKDSIDKVKLDMRFHQKLIENYPNQYVQKLIENIRVRVFIYEHQFMNYQPINESSKMHENIIQSIEADNLDKAVRTLRANWSLSINNISNIFKSNSK